MEKTQMNNILKEYPMLDKKELENLTEEEVELLPEVLNQIPFIDDNELVDLIDEELKLKVSLEEAKKIDDELKSKLDNWKIKYEE